jgi:hypothetical protein
VSRDGDGDRPDDPDWIAELAAQRRSGSETAPHGRAVSSALILPPGSLPRDHELRAVLKAIDSVHGDGELAAIPVRWGIPANAAVAEYTATADLAEAVSLTIDSRRARWMIGTVHEIGHFLDHRGIDDPTALASRQSPQLADWRVAVNSTSGYRSLVDRPAALEYLGQPEELWARSYAQWVALRSGDETLRRQIVELRGPDPSEIAVHIQWDAADFEPIADAFDTLFRRLGWIA